MTDNDTPLVTLPPPSRASEDRAVDLRELRPPDCPTCSFTIRREGPCDDATVALPLSPTHPDCAAWARAWAIHHGLALRLNYVGK